MPRPKSWNDAQLKEAYELGLSYPKICEALGITNTSKNRQTIKTRLRELGLLKEDTPG